MAVLCISLLLDGLHVASSCNPSTTLSLSRLAFLLFCTHGRALLLSCACELGFITVSPYGVLLAVGQASGFAVMAGFVSEEGLARVTTRTINTITGLADYSSYSSAAVSQSFGNVAANRLECRCELAISTKRATLIRKSSRSLSLRAQVYAITDVGRLADWNVCFYFCVAI